MNDTELLRIREELLGKVRTAPTAPFYRSAMQTAHESLYKLYGYPEAASSHLADLGTEAVEVLRAVRLEGHETYRTIGGMEIHYAGLRQFSFEVSVDFTPEITEGSVHEQFGFVLDQMYSECRHLQSRNIGNFMLIEKCLNEVIWEALGNKSGAFAIESHGIEYQGIETIVIPTEREMVENEFVEGDGMLVVAGGWL